MRLWKGRMMKITPADMWFSRCIRERADWTCEYPGCCVRYEPPTQALYCSHFEGRGKWAVRFEPLNGIALCYGHHRIVGSSPKTHNLLHAEIFGNWAAAIVEEKAQNLELAKAMKRTKGKGEIAKHYKAEYERMMQERAAGVRGRLEFVGFE